MKDRIIRIKKWLQENDEFAAYCSGLVFGAGMTFLLFHESKLYMISKGIDVEMNTLFTPEQLMQHIQEHNGMIKFVDDAKNLTIRLIAQGS